jgi:hypothetical protein
MSEEEEAELLARALEREGENAPAAIADALEMANAVRARRASLLEAERAQAVLGLVEQRIERRLARTRRRRVLFAGGGALAMAAAALLVFVRLEKPSSEPQVTAKSSAPRAASEQAVGGGPSLDDRGRELMAQQLQYTREGTRPDKLDEALAHYRASYLATLEAKYR